VIIVIFVPSWRSCCDHRDLRVLRGEAVMIIVIFVSFAAKPL